MEVRLDSKLVKIHQRQPKGGRATDHDDYPAELTAYTMKAPERIKRSAALLGPAVAQFAERLFDDQHPWSKIRQGHELIRLGKRYTAERLDAAWPAPWPSNSSTCAVSSASWCRPWNRRPCLSFHYPCQLAVSPDPAPSSPLLLEVDHDPHH